MNVVNISIDDVSPHPKSGFPEKQINRLLKEFPNIKITLFVPTKYTRKNEQSYPISKNPEFCELLRHLPRENFEIGYHGHLHGIEGISNNDEFENLDRDGSFKVFKRMFKEAEKSRVYFKSIFRPPAWRISPAALEVSKEVGIDVVTLSADSYAWNNYGLPFIRDLKYLYYNCAPPTKPLKIYGKYTSIVYHACEWDINYLNDDKTDQLIEFLKRHEYEIDFSFIQEMYRKVYGENKQKA